MTSQWHGGKGSKPRPTNLKAYEDNYDAIFGKKNKPADPAPEQTAPDTTEDNSDE